MFDKANINTYNSFISVITRWLKLLYTHLVFVSYLKEEDLRMDAGPESTRQKTKKITYRLHQAVGLLWAEISIISAYRS